MTIPMRVQKRKRIHENNNSIQTIVPRYNEGMSVQANYGAPRTASAKVASLTAAAMLVCMLLAQLFNYEDFAVTLGTVLPFNDIVGTKVLAASIVALELLALPYLLSMYLSALMRVTCALAAAAVALFWLMIAFTNAHASNSAFFSTTIDLPGGIIAALWAVVLSGLIAATIYGDTRDHSNPLEKKPKLR